jgi:hypothetical protein
MRRTRRPALQPRARDGTCAPISGPARRETGACVRTDPTWLGESRFCPPSHRALQPFWHEESRRRLGRPAGLARGRLGLSPRRRVHAWMLAFEPQYCRIAFVWSSRATHAPGPAVAMRGPSVFAGHRAERAVQELLCAAVSPRDVPLVTRRPRRANKVRPRVRYARLWPAHVQRAPC